MSKKNIYDVYKRTNGFMYRVSQYAPLHVQAELYAEYLQRWMPSANTVGGIIANDASTLIARNVVFKDSPRSTTPTERLT